MVTETQSARNIYTAPRMETDGFKYTFTFHNQELKATVDRLDPMRSIIKGALTIQTIERFPKTVLYEAAWELTSALQTKRLVDLMVERSPGPPWVTMFADIANGTKETYQAGTPWVNLADMEAPDDTVDYLVKPLLEAGTTTLLFADGGTGKSWLATAISTMIATGRPMGGLISAKEPMNVAYLDWESSEESYWRRVNGLCGSLGIPIPPTMFYRNLTGRLTMFSSEIRQWARSHDIGLVVVDSAAMAAGEAETQSDATKLFDAIRDIGSTCLTVAHVPKADASRPFGSVFMRNGPRSVWKLERDHDAVDGSLTIAAKHVKANNTALHSPLGWRFNFTDDGRTVQFQAADPNLIAEVEASRPLWKRIEEVLGEGALWAGEIAEELETPLKVVSAALRRGDGTAFTRLHTIGKNIQWGLASRG